MSGKADRADGVGLLILKQMYDLVDETVMLEWVSNPYFQYFCGETVFQWKFPCDRSDLVHFRHRIGASGEDIGGEYFDSRREGAK